MQSPKPYREERPWGEFIEFTRNTPCTVKIIVIKPHEALSLQRHAKRDEFWHVISGSGTLTIGTEKIEAVPGKQSFIARDTEHRMEAGPSEPLVVLEISLGSFEDSDIYRLDDRYGRADNISS